jgi:hypothetical protein
MTACAAFIKEGRMNFAGADNLHGNPGIPAREYWNVYNGRFAGKHLHPREDS